MLKIHIWYITHIYFTVLILSFSTWWFNFCCISSEFPIFLDFLFLITNKALLKDIHNLSYNQILLLLILLLCCCCFLSPLLLERGNSWHRDRLDSCANNSVRISPEHILLTRCGIILLNNFYLSHAKTTQMVSVWNFSLLSQKYRLVSHQHFFNKIETNLTLLDKKKLLIKWQNKFNIRIHVCQSTEMVSNVVFLAEAYGRYFGS